MHLFIISPIYLTKSPVGLALHKAGGVCLGFHFTLLFTQAGGTMDQHLVKLGMRLQFEKSHKALLRNSPRLIKLFHELLVDERKRSHVYIS